jgi:8-oxo-dGTP diphosphatase
MTDTHRFSVSVAGAVIRDDGKVLAIKRRDNGRWEPPGGVLESGERMLDGLTREVLEETGLTVEAECLSGVYQNLKRDIVALVFRCHVLNGQLRDSDETSDFEWLTASEVVERMTPAYAARLTDAMDKGGAKTRTHDGVSIV